MTCTGFTGESQVETGCFCYQICSQMALSIRQAWAELGQAQLKLELELSVTWFKIYCIQFINKNNTGYFDYH